MKEGDVIVLTKVDFAIRNGGSTRNGIGKEVFEGFPSIFTISEVRGMRTASNSSKTVDKVSVLGYCADGLCCSSRAMSRSASS